MRNLKNFIAQIWIENEMMHLTGLFLFLTLLPSFREKRARCVFDAGMKPESSLRTVQNRKKRQKKIQNLTMKVLQKV